MPAQRSQPSGSGSQPSGSGSQPSGSGSQPSEAVESPELADANAANAEVGDEAEVPMNRAERRAKGKAGSKPPVVGKIQPARVNNGPAPRSYANRRSG